MSYKWCREMKAYDRLLYRNSLHDKTLTHLLPHFNGEI